MDSVEVRLKENDFHFYLEVKIESKDGIGNEEDTINDVIEKKVPILQVEQDDFYVEEEAAVSSC